MSELLQDDVALMGPTKYLWVKFTIGVALMLHKSVTHNIIFLYTSISILYYS
jgi:hypothetical protein